MLLQGHSDPVLYIEMHFHIALNKRTIFFHGKSPSDAFEYMKEVERNEYNRNEVHCRIYLR